MSNNLFEPGVNFYRTGQISLRSLFIIAFSIGFILVEAQHAVDFSSQTQVCQGEFLKLQNNSEAAVQTKWSFCADQLDRAYSSTSVGSAIGNMTDLAIVEDNGQWYGFATSRNNVLVRLNFGSNPNNTYTITPITDDGNLLVSPEGISIIKEGDNWIGLITLINSEIIRVSWGASLAGMPQLQSLNLNYIGKLNAPTQINIEYDQGNYVAVIANATGNFITMINFGVSLNNTVDTDDMIVSPAFPSATDLYGVTVSKQCDQWILYAIAHNHIYRVDLGSSLFSPISIGQINDFTASLPISVGQYNKIQAVDIGKNAYIYFISFTNQYVAAINWQEGSSSPQFLSLGNPSVPGNPFGFDVFYYNNQYLLYVAGFGGSLNRISTDGICHSNLAFSTDENPVGVSYDQPGTYTIHLEQTYSDGQTCSQTKQIIVTSNKAPLPVITNDNICVSSTVTFSAVSQNEISIDGWSWDFGTGTSLLENPTYIFNTAGDYTINLEVTSSNGCSNTAFKSLKIYDPPASSFILPSGIICTNNELIFTNNTVDNFDGNLSYQWLVNNTSESTERDFEYIFTSGGYNEIKLVTSIPGCANEITQTLNSVQIGPAVGFSQAGQCEDDQMVFSNSSSGDIATYLWNFGDGQTSMDRDATIVYPNPAQYLVSLQATGTNGCISSISKTVPAYSKPQPDFSLDLPPFSCAGSLSQFNDLTPNPTDSNISSWLWNFGDAQNGTSGIQNAQYTYTTAGQYNVSLTTTTNFGCTGTAQKQVTIQQSPLASFTNSAACVNQGTSFVDTSTGSIKSRLWNIGGSTYTTPTVSNTFTSSGNFQSQLTVTGNNNCVATVTKTIVVPVPPVLDFSVQNNCSDQAAIFTDTTPVGTDPVSTRIWDFANQGTATGSPVQHVFSTVGTYGVRLTVTNQSGCSYPITKNVAITKTPTANFTPLPQSGPAPLAVQFNNTSTNATSYLWQFNDAAGSTSDQLSPSFTFTMLGKYLVKLTATSLLGCQDTFNKEINVIVPHPDLAIDEMNAIRNTTTGTIKISVTIHNKGNSIISGSTLFIDASGASILKENVSSTIRPGETLIYVTNTELVLREDEIKYLCAELSIVDDQDISNNKECFLVENEIVYFPVYPKPSEGQLHVDWIAAQGSGADVTIVNSFGQNVFTKHINATREGLNQLEFDVSNFSAGVYILIFQIDGEKKSFRFSTI